MKKAEIILASIALLAIILKAMLIPFAAILLILSLLSLAIVYMATGTRIFAKQNKEENSIENNEKISTFAGYAMAIACVGILFSILNWPGSRVQLMIGFAGTSVLFVIVAWLYVKTEEHQRYYKSLAGRLIVFVALSGCLAMCSPFDLFSFFHRNDPGYIEVYRNFLENPKDTVAANTYFHYLDQKK